MVSETKRTKRVKIFQKRKKKTTREQFFVWKSSSTARDYRAVTAGPLRRLAKRLAARAHRGSIKGLLFVRRHRDDSNNYDFMWPGKTNLAPLTRIRRSRNLPFRRSRRDRDTPSMAIVRKTVPSAIKIQKRDGRTCVRSVRMQEKKKKKVWSTLMSCRKLVKTNRQRCAKYPIRLVKTRVEFHGSELASERSLE